MDIATVQNWVIAAGGVLSAVIVSLWRSIVSELTDCKKDRLALGEKIDAAHAEMNTISKEVGQLSGRLTEIERTRTP